MKGKKWSCPIKAIQIGRAQGLEDIAGLVQALLWVKCPLGDSPRGGMF